MMGGGMLFMLVRRTLRQSPRHQFCSPAQTGYGRNPGESSIVFPPDAPGISRKHCSISIDKTGNVLIRDLGSSMGTFLEDGTKLRENISYRLERGESFYLANKQEVYRII